MIETSINGKWSLMLPDHRAARPEWPVWERERLASMWLNIAATDVVLDVGAEEGDLSALFASWCAGIVLVEPNPLAWPCIQACFAGNNLPDPIAFFQGFCSADGAELPARLWPASSDGPIVPDHGFLHLAEDSAAETSIDTLADVCPPNVITMDIEGAELEALKGARHTLTYHRPIVWVSVHREFMAHHFGQTPRDLLRFMERFDYRAVHLADDHEAHWMFEPR